MSKLARILRERATAWATQRVEEEIGRGDLHDDDLDSGVHETPPELRSVRKRAARTPAEVEQEVTLIVYAWENVQPGPMSWAFPNARQAVSAAKAMRNAVSWAILRGKQPTTALDAARVTGDVLFEKKA